MAFASDVMRIKSGNGKDSGPLEIRSNDSADLRVPH